MRVWSVSSVRVSPTVSQTSAHCGTWHCSTPPPRRCSPPSWIAVAALHPSMAPPLRGGTYAGCGAAAQGRTGGREQTTAASLKSEFFSYFLQPKHWACCVCCVLRWVCVCYLLGPLRHDVCARCPEVQVEDDHTVQHHHRHQHHDEHQISEKHTHSHVCITSEDITLTYIHFLETYPHPHPKLKPSFYPKM